MKSSRWIRQEYAPHNTPAMRERLSVMDYYWYMGLPLAAELICTISRTNASGNARQRRQARRRMAEKAAFTAWFVAQARKQQREDNDNALRQT